MKKTIYGFALMLVGLSFSIFFLADASAHPIAVDRLGDNVLVTLFSSGSIFFFLPSFGIMLYGLGIVKKSIKE